MQQAGLVRAGAARWPPAHQGTLGRSASADVLPTPVRPAIANQLWAADLYASYAENPGSHATAVPGPATKRWPAPGT